MCIRDSSNDNRNEEHNADEQDEPSAQSVVDNTDSEAEATDSRVADIKAKAREGIEDLDTDI